MAFFTDVRLYLIILHFNLITSVVSKGKPHTPETYYALVSSTAKLPCIAANSGDQLRWYAEHEDNALGSRTSSHTDKSDPDRLTNVITNVRPSDAGSFVCSDGVEISNTQLVVFEPPPVQSVEAITSVPDEIQVRWKAPAENTDLVRGYNIYVTEVGQEGKEVKIAVNSISPDGQEEYTLTDFIPGATYEIQVTPLYVAGVEEVGETAEGPRSPKVRINTPKFESVPSNVKAEPWFNSTILVTWLPPKHEGSSGVDGYTVYYKAIGKKDSPSGEVTVTRRDTNNRWSAVLKGLKTKNKYKIHVVPFTGGSQKIAGQKSQEVLVAHDGFIPELSVRAIPVSPDTVLVTVDTVGGDKIDRLRVLYSDDSAVKWTRVDDYNSKEKYAVVTGLQPRTRYFFNVKATVNKKARSVVTHVMTPPAAFSPATNISVTAKTDSSVHLTWSYDGRVPARGFIILTEKLLPDGSVSPVKQNVVFKQNEAVVDSLDTGEKYQVKVEPFDLENIGTCSEPILFQLNVAGETTLPEPERKAPEFVDVQHDELQINTGDEVRLMCTAVGTPYPVVHWFKDSAPIGKPFDRAAELVLPNVRESTVLTCRASNDVGTIARDTNVIVTPEIEPQAPSFSNSLPETQLVHHGSEVRQWCNATGNPVPLVSWYKDNVVVLSNAGSAEFVERRASRHFDLKCVARNEFGSIDGVTKVYIRDLLRNPTLSSQLPSIVEKREGEQLVIPCSFSGNPMPMVAWYDGAARLGDPATGQNTLKINSVERTTVLICRGENILAKTDETVQLEVIPKKQPRWSDYKVVLKDIKQSPSEVIVKWAVNEGNIGDISHFDVKLITDTGKVVKNQKRRSNRRTETFKRLSPHSRYTVNVQTVTSRGVVDNSSVEFTLSTPDSSSDRSPVLFLDVVEIRDNTVMVDFSTKNVDTRQFHQYRVRVNDLDSRFGNSMLNRDDIRPDMPFFLENLKPNRNYQVIIEEALAQSGSTPLTVIANFVTPGPGQYGAPVSATSDASSQPSSPQVVSATPTSRLSTALRGTQPNEAERTLRTTASTEKTTIKPPLIVITTVGPVEEPENHDYAMTAKIRNTTPYSVDIRWSVDRGPVENIKNYLVTIKGERGNTLLEQNLPENQRSITVHSLNPNTRYFVNVKAIGGQGDLVGSEVSFQTAPEEATIDTSNPVLELEANEVRANSTRIDWTAINVEPDLVKNYKMQVLDNGPGGFNMLTEVIQPSSQSLNIQKLEPNRRYHVILEALAADNSVLMTSSLTFETPSPNRYGVPVVSSSRAGLQPKTASRQPVPDHMSKSQRSMLGSHGGKDDTSSDPVLHFRINPQGSASHHLTWSVQNIPDGLVVGYVLKIRSSGPQGSVILQERLSLHETSFRLDGLAKDRHYFLELDAISQSGSSVLSVGTLYSPGRSAIPVQVTSKPSDGGLPQPKSHEGDSQVDDDNATDVDSKPEIDLELNPFGHNQVKVNWTVIKENRRRPVASYKVKVHLDGPEGRKLLEDQLAKNTLFYTVYDLLENVHYYIHFDALDKDGSVIEWVASPYLVPPPGYGVEPIIASSVLNKKTVTTGTTVGPTKQDRVPERDEPVIRSVHSQGPNALLVEWYIAPTDAKKPTQETIVRYAEFRGNERDNFKIEVVPAGQQRLVIRDLKPDTSYGIQVAAMGTGGYHIRWSRISLWKTDRN